MTVVSMPNVTRGCGGRKAGGIYAVVPTGPGGVDPRRFIVDFPIPTTGLPVATQGVSMFERGGVWHVLDRIGLDSYANPAMFYEEYAKYGVSRRLPEHLDYSKLTPASRLFLIHDHALIVNFEEYIPKMEAELYEIAPYCVTGRHGNWDVVKGGDHPNDPERRLSCVSYWWLDFPTPGTDRFCRTVAVEDENKWGWFKRPQDVELTFGSTIMRAGQRPDGVTPEYEQAICFNFPLTMLQVITGGRSEIAKAKVAPAAQNGLVVGEAAY